MGPTVSRCLSSRPASSLDPAGEQTIQIFLRQVQMTETSAESPYSCTVLLLWLGRSIREAIRPIVSVSPPPRLPVCLSDLSCRSETAAG